MRSSPLPPPVWMLLFAVAMWLLQRHWPVLILIPAPWNRLGWAVMAAAAAAPIAAFRQFTHAHTTPNPHTPEATTTLVTTGVYAWTRNPMYLGLSGLLLGWAIRLGALSAFAGPLLFVPLMVRIQIRPEECTLRAKFGEDYERYCRGVNRWLGRSGPASS